MKKIILDGESLTLDQAVLALRPDASVKIHPRCKEKVNKARAVVESAVRQKKVVYGITTGFGALSNVVISKTKCRQLQINVLRSHSAGVGEPLADEIVRLTILFMINSKAKGYSGLRWSTIGTLLNLFNKRLVPRVPAKWT